MKFLSKKILKISSIVGVITPTFLVASCSNEKLNYNVSDNSRIYSTIWNLSTIDQIKNSIFDLTVQELENTINNELKNDIENNFVMKIYCFYMLWNAIKNPLTESGQTQTNLSNEITDFGNFLSTKLSSDSTQQTTDSTKTYVEFKKYINSFEYKISIVNFFNEKIDNTRTIREILSNGEYKLNFKFDFWTSDEDTNKKIISKNNNQKSIIYKNSLTRELREKINKIQNEEVKEITTNQYSYQSTKLYYTVANKTFSSILLPSNIYNNLKESTSNSGYSTNDASRELFIFNWYSKSENSLNYESFLDFLLNKNNNFNTSLNSDWKLFLTKEGLVETKYDSSTEMKKIKINLRKSFKFDISQYE